jgi:anti-sigma factor RsiW
MTDEHVPIEDLAAYAAGDLDAAAAVAVEAHVLLCEDCRADVEGLKITATALAAVPRVTMPADVARRVDESYAGDRRAPLGDVVPMAPRRRRPSLSAIAAVAAGLFLVGAVGVSLRPHHDKKADTSAVGPEAAPVTRRLSSGLAYSPDALGPTLNRALSSTVQQTDSKAGGVSAPPAAPSATAVYLGEQRDTALAPALRPLETDAGRLAACIAELREGYPEAARAVLLVDYGTFAGPAGTAPAMVIAFPALTKGAIDPAKVDVYVAGAGCGVKAGGDFLYFRRIARPSGL